MTETPVDTRFVSVADFARFARGRADDPDLVEALDAALANVSTRVGPLDAASSFTVWSHGGALVLPITHLSAVVEVRDPLGVLVTPSRVNLLAGVVHVRERSRPGTWTISVTSTQRGADIALAVKIIAQHLLSLRSGADVGQRSRLMVPTDDAPATGFGFAIPRRAAELLAPYTLGGLGA